MADLGTDLYYGGIWFRNCLVEMFQQESVMDASNVDLRYHRITLRVSGVVHAANSDIIHGVEVDGNGTASKMQSIWSALQTPRRQLRMTVGGEILLDVAANNDFSSGPRPKSVTVTNIANNVYRASFEVECCVLWCGGSLQINNPSGKPTFGKLALTNRWSLSESIDENHVTRRTWAGQVQAKIHTPSMHEYRNIIIPPLLKGYRRVRQDYVSEADGLTFNYVVEDVRNHAAPPYPATTWRATHTEISLSSGITNRASVNCELTGPPEVNRRSLLAAAIAVCEARIGKLAIESFNTPTQHVGAFLLESLRITDHMDSPRVEVSIQVMRKSKPEDFAAAVYDNLGKHIDEITPIGIELTDYDHTKNPVIPAYDGQSPAEIFAQYVNTACSEGKEVASLGAGSTTVLGSQQTEPQGSEPTFDLVDVPLRQFQGLQITSAHAANIYTHFYAFSKYHTNHGKIAMATASDGGNQQGGQSSVVVVQIHEPITFREVHIKAERIGAWPQFPRPDDIQLEGETVTLLDTKVQLDNPEPLASGNIMFRAEVKYEFVTNKSPKATDSLRPVAHPANPLKPGDLLFNGTTQFVEPQDLM